MEISLADLFYTIGIVVLTAYLLLLIALMVAAWYLYRWYRTMQQKISSTPALFFAKKILTNPMKVGTGMMVLELIGNIFKFMKKRRK